MTDPKPPPGTELFTLVDGQREDASLHEPILAAGEAASEGSRWISAQASILRGEDPVITMQIYGLVAPTD